MLYWLAWHFGWYDLLFPFGLASLAVPAAIGYAWALVLPGNANSIRSAGAVVTLVAFVLVAVTYACSLYALGRVIQLLPEFYKFGSGLVDVSLSTVRLWLGLSAVCLLGAIGLRRYVAPSYQASVLSRATIGMVITSAAIFGPFLLSSHAAYRA
jgi:hypothetical protein